PDRRPARVAAGGARQSSKRRRGPGERGSWRPDLAHGRAGLASRTAGCSLCFGLDFEPSFGGAQLDPKEPQEAFLTEEVERERPRVAESDGGVVADAGDRQIRARVPRD